ncbi:Ankyrin repeat domain-containing 50 [Paramuricea clavata]|uniref:mitogen-activated protein kinase kinase n=1 Tax=Paramuricea clavata TaxID=317549 RepID=A0A7D9HT76_PARCT|nr:Ankyrin repeat domain-containing 50 [Paramuricea clavata]
MYVHTDIDKFNDAATTILRSLDTLLQPEMESHLKNATDLAKTTGREANVTVVGKYRYFKDKPIGSGAFSLMFLAIKDEHLDKRSGTIQYSLFALKRIEKANVNPKEIIREVKTLILFSNECENIVKYYGFEHSKDEFFHYLCLDLMDGNLNEFVTNDVNKVLKEDPAICVQATKEIINGLEYLHEQMFIHCDLKPENILYTTVLLCISRSPTLD